MVQMDAFSWNLVLAAVAIGLTHTVLGPDHYLPFVMLARARGWTMSRTVWVTALCGVGHVASSIALGGVGLMLGWAVAGIESVESSRGDLAAWGLLAFGLAYAVWGIRRAIRGRGGLEPHAHGCQVHMHAHEGADHHHTEPIPASATTFWTLFVIFVLGPCEPLIALFVLPASRGRWELAILTGLIFGFFTVLSMVVLTVAGTLGATRLPLGPLERWAHTLAGGVIAASGAAILALGI